MRLPRLRTAQALVVACVLLVIGIVALEAARTLRHEYRSRVDDVLAAGDRTAQKLAARTTEVFDGVNQATLLVKFLTEQGANAPLSALRTAGVISDNLVQFLYVADRRGFVSTTTAALSALNVADEDFFKHHRREADLDVLVAPVWVDPITGAKGIPVTRRLGAHGSFDGVIVAMVDPAALSLAYARTEAEGTAVGILGADGIYRSRTVDGALSFGERTDPAQLVARASNVRRTGKPVKSPIDGVSRFVSAAKIDKYPLYAVVAVDARHAIGAYRQARTKVLTWAALVIVVTLLAGSLLLEQARRLDASRRIARKAEAAFRATLEGSLDAVAILEAKYDAAHRLQDLTVTDCNSLAAGLFGLDRESMVGRGLCELAPSLRSGGSLKFFDEVIRTQRRKQAEAQATDPPLVGKWLHHQLVPLSNGVALITRDVTEKKAAEAALATLARSDGLTGLSNRRHFEEVLEQALARAARSGDTLALMYLDLDGFKAVNDSFGHAAGDAVLVEVARRLRSIVRVTDTVGRLGGDEFAVLAESAGSLQDVQELGRRLVDVLREAHEVSQKKVGVTPSVGVALFDGKERSQSLCERADAAMYRAKTTGKSRYVLAAAHHGAQLEAV